MLLAFSFHPTFQIETENEKNQFQEQKSLKIQ